MISAKQVILTYEGLKKLEDELDYLKTVRRRDVAQKIKQALTFGDLAENSEYDEAKNEQAQLEIRILNIENMLKNAKIIDEDEVDTTIVSIGSKVKLLDMELNEELTYSIVGSTEAEPALNKISDESPVGKALLGHSVGDTVSVLVPSGDTLKFKILEISK